jgi:hypothetical protein
MKHRQYRYLRVDFSIDVAADDFSGGELPLLLLLEPLPLLEMVELVIIFFCCTYV